MTSTIDILKRAKTAADDLLDLSSDDKNNALFSMAKSLINNTDKILEANKQDVIAATGILSEVMIDRLMLDKSRIEAMAAGIEAVAQLEDPVGRILFGSKCDNGLSIEKISVPLGVVAIIYESRPNVTSDAAALCFKSGNVCILRSGKDAFRSAFVIVEALREGLSQAGFSKDYVNLIEDTTRASANELMTAVGYVDLLIPRGGAGLIKACVDNAKVPCIQTGTGICHIYVDKAADTEMALNIIENAKVSRPSVCNAAEVCLIHKDIAEKFLPLLNERLTNSKREHRVELRGDEDVKKILNTVKTGENDYDTEFLDYILAIKIVDDVNDAVKHIALHSTHHSEAIITADNAAAEYFTSHVDSAAVYVNASTRFTDGGEFGLGCEMGISTQKLHARGPMGLSELNTYKYIIKGNGNIR